MPNPYQQHDHQSWPLPSPGRVEASRSPEELERKLAGLAHQIAGTGSRNTHLLQHMQQRLGALGEDAQSLREELLPEPVSAIAPRGNRPAALGASAIHIEDRAAAGWKENRSVSALIFDDQPWDRTAADALRNIYESWDAGRASPLQTSEEADFEPAAAESVGGPNPDDRAWFETRFADIAKRFEQGSTSEIPDNKIAALASRFAQLEDRVDIVMKDVLKRSDAEGLMRIEAQIDELSEHVGLAQAQLARIEGIDQRLLSVVQHLDELGSLRTTEPVQEDKVDLEALVSSALETLVNRASEQATTFETKAVEIAGAAVERELRELRLTDHAGGDAQRLSELHETLSSFIREYREEGTHTAAVLDTLQQAMLRVLDRMDAMEESHLHRPPPFPAVTEARDRSWPQEPQSAAPQVIASMASDFVAETQAIASLNALPQKSVEPYASAGDAAQGPLASQAPELNNLERVRQDLIAEAKRARAKAEAEAAARQTAAKKKLPPAPQTGKPAARMKKGVIGTGRSPLMSPRGLMIAAIALLLAIPGGVLLVMPRKPPPAATQIPPANAVPAKPAEGEPAGKGATTEPVPNKRQIGSAWPPEPNGEGAEPASGFRFKPAGLATPIQEKSAALINEEDAANSPFGITVDGSGTANALQLVRARQEQSMAALSTRLGVAAADVTPAAFTLESGAAAATADPSASSTPVTGPGPASLPPATVGPLSLRVSAANGDPSAEFEVGARLAEGKGTDQNLQDAVKWFQRSAAQGFAQAQYRLASHYERGLGVKTDAARARIWYQRAAEQGHIKSMHNLAVMSAGSDANAPDYATAAHWFSEAAAYGLPDSQYNLAILYQNGLGVKQDIQQAFKWLTLAARSGDAQAMQQRDQVAATLDAAALAAAGEAIAAWRTKPSNRLINDARAAGEDWKRRQNSGGPG